MKKRVADIIMETLIEYGITDCFAVVGGGAMHLDNALLKCKEMNKTFQHHEQACAISAEAYARMSGGMAAVCVTSGPGATNTLTGVMGAWQDSIPMIVLSGQVRYAISVPQSGLDLRYRGIQEFEIIPTVKNMTKYATMIIDPLSIKQEVIKAIKIAMSGRRGPVWLDIPQDIQNVIVEEDELYDIKIKCSNKIDECIIHNQIQEVIDLLKNSKRPCILTGSAIRSSNVMEQFLEFIKNVEVPIIGGAWVADNMYHDYPLYYGMSGNVGPRTGNFILQNADLIISLGNSLGFRQTGFNQEGFAAQAKIIMVDIDENEAKKPGLNIFKYIQSGLKDFFDNWNNISKECISAQDDWVKYCDRLYARFSRYEGCEGIDMHDRVCAYYFWEKWCKLEHDDSILALGNNTANTAKLQIGIDKKEQRVLTNYTCGSMGYDIPAAIGAAIASRKPVYCITGDGSIMMNLQELQTIVQYDLPIDIVVFENEGYGAIRQTSKNFFNGEYIGCTPDSGISFPDFKKIADTFGFKYILCETNEQVEDSLNELFESKTRVLCEVKQRLDDPITPKVMSRIDEDGNMLTPVLHDMYPFLEKEVLDKLLLIEG